VARLTAEIVSVGTELLLGQIANTNAQYLSRVLNDLGYDVYYHTAVGDNRARAAAAVRQALDRSDLVVTTGGLGPTTDDLTREAVADALGLPLELDEGTLGSIARFFEARGRPMPESNRRQALVPRGGRPIPNAHGTAPGILVEHGDKVVLLLPGPPAELVPMVEDSVRPYLARRAGGRPMVLVSRVLKSFGIGESDAEQRVLDLIAGQSNPTIAPLIDSGEVHFRITAKAPDRARALALIAGVEERLRERLGDHIFGADDETLEGAVAAALVERRFSLAVAESCTGGLITHSLTNVPGSSRFLERGLVCYSNASKVQLLGIDEALLAAHGAVSEPVAKAMADGVRRAAGTDYGLSTTGIAGPGGGTPDKPVGLVYIGVAGPRGTRVQRHRFMGQRQENKRRFTQQALALLRRAVLDPGWLEA